MSAKSCSIEIYFTMGCRDSGLSLPAVLLWAHTQCNYICNLTMSIFICSVCTSLREWEGIHVCAKIVDFACRILDKL